MSNSLLYTDEQLIGAVMESKNWNQVSNHLFGRDTDNTISGIQARVNELGINTAHFTKKILSKGGRVGSLHNDELFIMCEKPTSRGRYGNIKHVIRRLKEMGKFNVCEKCSQTSEWNGESLQLQLHHVNGNNLDNRLENLQILCPNCHTQTETYAKNKRYCKE